MKKLLKLGRLLLAAGLTAVMLTSTAAFGSESYDNLAQAELNDGYNSDSEVYEGTYVHDYVTGETKLVPGYNPVPQNHSDETSVLPEFNIISGENSEVNAIDASEKTTRTPLSYSDYTQANKQTVFIEFNYYNNEGEVLVGYGSGVMIGQNAVLTAGHLLYNTEDFYDKNGGTGSRWSFNVKVMPAHYKSDTGKYVDPFGSATAKTAHVSNEWAKNQENVEDWGILELDWNIGKFTGYIDASYDIKNVYMYAPITVNGYPEMEKGVYVLGTQYTREGKCMGHDDTIFTSNTAFISNCDSGGPCLTGSKKNGFTLIGITIQMYGGETYDTQQYSIYRRINESLYNEIVKYRTSTLY